MEVEEKVMNEEKLKMYLTILNDENPSHVKENAKTNIIILFEKQQKEIERLKDDGIGDTKFDKLLFSIRMLHFHHYINDTQFEKMINKLSNENKGE